MKRVSAILLAVVLLLAACGDDGGVFGTSTSGAGSTTSDGAGTTGAGTTATTAETSTTGASTTTAPTTTTGPAVPIVTAQLDEFAADAQPGCAPVDYSISSPVVSGLPEAINTHINERIHTAILDRQSQFYTDTYNGCDPSQAGEPHAFFNVSFEATMVSARLLSLRIMGSEFYQGAAHPVAFVFTLSFRPVTGDLLSLDGILVPGGVPSLAALVEQHIIDDLYGGDAVEAHTWVPAVTPDMLADWVVSPGGIEVSFDPYLIGPGAMGAPTVVVPYAELVGIIDPAGPAAPA